MRIHPKARSLWCHGWSQLDDVIMLLADLPTSCWPFISQDEDYTEECAWALSPNIYSARLHVHMDTVKTRCIHMLFCRCRTHRVPLCCSEFFCWFRRELLLVCRWCLLGGILLLSSVLLVLFLLFESWVHSYNAGLSKLELMYGTVQKYYFLLLIFNQSFRLCVWKTSVSGLCFTLDFVPDQTNNQF